MYWQITSSGAPIPHRYLEASKRLDSRLLRLNPYRLRRPSKTYQEIFCLTSNEGTEAIGENRNKSKVACSVQRKTISELSTAMNDQREEMMSLRWPVARSRRGLRSAVSCFNNLQKLRILFEILLPQLCSHQFSPTSLDVKFYGNI